MNKYIQILILVVLTAAVVYLVPRKQPQNVTITSYEQCVEAGGQVTEGVCTSPTGECCFYDEEFAQPEVIVDTPQPGDVVTSPLQVKGRAKGYWYFEANLPVTLKDQNGNILVKKGFQAQGNWMTEEYVEFDDVLIFTEPPSQFGALIIEKDNPSGESQFDAAFAVPLLFQ